MIKTFFARIWKWLCNEIAVEVPGDVDIDGDGPEMPPVDDVDYGTLQWCYGGFRGEAAVRSDDVRIVLDSVSGGGLRYHYAAGDLRAIDSENSHDNPNCIAALFVCGPDGVWKGGKFDWISSDRLFRDFANIKSGYHGWQTDAVATADAYAFCIVSNDGRWRTNVTVLEGNR